MPSIILLPRGGGGGGGEGGYGPCVQHGTKIEFLAERYTDYRRVFEARIKERKVLFADRIAQKPNVYDWKTYTCISDMLTLFLYDLVTF